MSPKRKRITLCWRQGVKRTQSLIHLGKTFQWCKDPDKLLDALQDGALRHHEYHQYLKLGHLEKMFLGDKMLLRRGNSTELDDWRECGEFGNPELWFRIYLGCFCHERTESAAFWWMYGQGKEDAVRLTFRRPILRLWLKKLKTMESVQPFIGDEAEKKIVPEKHAVSQIPFFTDVAYATIRKPILAERSIDSVNTNGVLAVSWDGICRHVTDLDAIVKKDAATGRFKDYEWRFERETRLIVEIKPSKSSPDQIIVPVDWKGLSEIGSIRITAGPWMPERKFIEMKRRLEMILRGKRIDPYAFPIQRSCLTGALNYRK